MKAGAGNDDTLDGLSDPVLEQYFLVSDEKIRLIMDAAGVRQDDRVVELGAGAGTVARRIPRCGSLTVIELDARLTGFLQENAPGANVIQGDALVEVQRIPCDVLISNLPDLVTESLINILPRLSFRTAVLAVGEESGVARLLPEFDVSEVTTIYGD
ncbi:MAG: rRNA (adenine1518-N6/adenine1519-N6)-dimethyltransferase, partial [Actinomycetota bacterium]|nr:rRNA (adenine1518-N6/adenine1519-N6)-dimethyltransferase [Actinomycetota bacterium]